jgi:hypothetical protein
MHTTTSLRTALAIAALLALPMAHAATGDKAAYKAGKDSIAATYKSDKDACGSLAGNAKDICMEEAKGKEKVAKAELEYGYTGKPKDQNAIAVAKADAAYAVAKEKCDDLAGNPKDVCVKEAKAQHTRGLADAKVTKVSADARRDAGADKRDADYKVATEKCEALAGDAKTGCMNDAKARFGKS